MKLTGLFVALLLVVALDARADFYKYRDSSGALVITDKLENVPQKYRNQFKVVWDADLEAKDPLARRKAAAKAQMEKQEKQQQERQKEAEKKKPAREKQLVISIDEETGKVIRRFE